MSRPSNTSSAYFTIRILFPTEDVVYTLNSISVHFCQQPPSPNCILSVYRRGGEASTKAICTSHNLIIYMAVLVLQVHHHQTSLFSASLLGNFCKSRLSCILETCTLYTFKISIVLIIYHLIKKKFCLCVCLSGHSIYIV